MTHIKRLILTTFILLLISPFFGGDWDKASAQKMPDILRTMPDSIIPLLSHNDRLDFVDYAAAGTNAELTNRLSGKSKLLTLTDDFAHWQLTTHSDLQLKLLPQGDTHIICLVSTAVVDSLPDSHIRFYTTSWKPLSTSSFFPASFPTSQSYQELRFADDQTDLILTTRQPSLPYEGEKNVPATESSKRFVWKEERFSLVD